MKPVNCNFCPTIMLRERRRPVNICPGCKRAYMRRWYADNAEKRKAYRREWRRNNKDKRNAWEAKYRDSHRIHVRKKARDWWRKDAKKLKAMVLSLPCLECGLFHDEATRSRIIKRMLPCESIDLKDAHPCLWSGLAGDQKLNRDLRKIASRKGHTWYPKEQRAMA